jgi:hypothetical protein
MLAGKTDMRLDVGTGISTVKFPEKRAPFARPLRRGALEERA